MHIGIDLNLQALNSNVFGKLQHEEKDYWLNDTTEELVKAVLLDEKNTVFNLLTYADIRRYFEVLQVYIRNLQLGITEASGQGYAYGILPSDITTGLITSGVLYHGIKYKVVIAGTTDLSAFGYKVTPIVNETFECDITTGTGATIPIVSGEKYRIINAHGATLAATYGAPNDLPGTEFIATASGAGGGGVSTVIQNLTDAPTWVGTTLMPVYNQGFYLPIDATSDVTKGNPITSGSLTIGERYIVSIAGTTNLSGIGGVATPDVGYIFTCSSASAPMWQGGTILYLINNVGNRLIKMQDVKLVLANSFGSMKTSPISVYANDRLRVYHDNKFSIERLYIDYIIKPITVDWNSNTNSDLPTSLHGRLVKLTAERIAATTSNPNYPAIDKENKEIVQ